MFVEDYVYPDMMSPEDWADYQEKQKNGTLKRPSLWETALFNSTSLTIDNLRKKVAAEKEAEKEAEKNNPSN